MTKPLKAIAFEASRIDELEQFVSEHLASVTAKPRHAGPMESGVKMNLVGQLLSWSSRFSAGIDFTPVTPPDLFILHMPRRGGTDFLCGGAQQATPSYGFVEAGRMTTLVRHNNETEQVCLAVPRALLTQNLASRLGKGLTDELIFFSRFDLNSSLGRTMTSIADSISFGLDDEAALLRAPLAAQTMVDTVVQLMLAGLPHNYTADLTQMASPASPRHVKAAMEYIRVHAAEPLTIPQIADVVGVSVRALQSGFRRFHDTTATAYVRRVRLEAARRQLLDPTDGRSVAEIARAWGFVHLGHFSAHYQATFGENPSQRPAEVRKRRARG